MNPKSSPATEVELFYSSCWTKWEKRRTRKRHICSLKLLDGESLVAETQELKIHTGSDNDKVGRQRGQRRARSPPWLPNEDAVLKGRMVCTMHSICLQTRCVGRLMTSSILEEMGCQAIRGFIIYSGQMLKTPQKHNCWTAVRLISRWTGCPTAQETKLFLQYSLVSVVLEKSWPNFLM